MYYLYLDARSNRNYDNTLNDYDRAARQHTRRAVGYIA
jgi:hypothetical protein